jgi:hypothetical protein
MMAPPSSHWRALTKLSFLIASLLVLASVPPLTIATDTTKPTCTRLTSDHDLRTIARDQNVLLLVHPSTDDTLRKHICNKLDATPSDRIVQSSGRFTSFAYLEIKTPSYDASGQLQDSDSKSLASSLGIKSFPAVAFLSGGMNSSSKYSQHITHYTGSTSDMPSVEKFIQSQVGYHLGNDVYNIVFFDSIASKFVSYGDCSGLNRLKQKGLALLVKFSTMFSYKEPFWSIGKLYNRAFDKSLEKGMGYATDQIARIERLLEKDGSGLTSEKIHEMNQKRAILKSFAEPRVLTVEDQRQIWIHVLLHVGLIVATVMLFVLPNDDGGEEEDGEVVNEVPVIARVVEEENGGKVGKKKHH